MDLWVPRVPVLAPALVAVAVVAVLVVARMWRCTCLSKTRVTLDLGRRVSVEDVIIGCSGLAGLFRELTEREAVAAVRTALASGFRSFDTAPHYGLGLSEKRLGTAIATLQESSPCGASGLSPGDSELTLYTKAGRLVRSYAELSSAEQDRVERENMRNSPACIFPATDPDLAPLLDYSGAGVYKSLRESLVRLRVSRVHGLRLHDCEQPSRFEAAMAAGGGVEALLSAREEGLVNEVGLGMNDPYWILRILREHNRARELDSVMMAGRWNLLDQSGMEVLRECEASGIAVQLAGVYASGLLVGGSTFNYMAAPQDMIDRTRQWQAIADSYGKTLPQVAVAFAFLPKVVTKIAIGVRTAQEVRRTQDILRSLETDAVPSALWREAQARGLLPRELDLVVVAKS
mmetsp:Transcript_7829/g.22234  ORF Transcript_7829/g.22234 Transcript_7829/m.22234 type:complete len:403 (-) Transcript_7829:40-1248(-)